MRDQDVDGLGCDLHCTTRSLGGVPFYGLPELGLGRANVIVCVSWTLRSPNLSFINKIAGDFVLEDQVKISILSFGDSMLRF